MAEKNKLRVQKRGYPLPAGVTILKEGINFSIFARHATKATLVIDHIPKGSAKPIRLEFPLDPLENRTGDMWHILLLTHQQNFLYGYRFDGTNNNNEGLVYDYSKILLDPCCNTLAARRWGEPTAYGVKPCCVISNQDFDWQNDRPLKTPLSETIIYELHIRGFHQRSQRKGEKPRLFSGNY